MDDPSEDDEKDGDDADDDDDDKDDELDEDDAKAIEARIQQLELLTTHRGRLLARQAS